MHHHHVRLQHGRTSACFAWDKLLGLNFDVRVAPGAKQNEPGFFGARRRACGVAEEAPTHAMTSSVAAARPHECMLRLGQAARA
jgi:hypothetical protein